MPETISFTIKVNGEPIADTIQILSISTEKKAGEVSIASIIILDGDAETGTFEVSSSPAFTPGNTISISAGYDGAESEIFSGITNGQSINIDEHGSALQVECAGNVAVIEPGADTNPVYALTYGNNILELYTQLSMYGHPTKRGEVKFQGTSLLSPGKYICLQNVGDRFNGDYQVLSVIQQIADGNWITEIFIEA